MTGKELKERREAAGLSQSALAKIWNIRRPTISDWESEKISIGQPVILDHAMETVERRYSETGKKRKTKRDSKKRGA